MVSLEFFIDITLPPAVCPWGRCVRLTALPPSCADCHESGSLNLLETSGPVQVCAGIELPLPFNSHNGDDVLIFMRGSLYPRKFIPQKLMKYDVNGPQNRFGYSGERKLCRL